MMNIKKFISSDHDIRRKWYLDILFISTILFFPGSRVCFFSCHGNEHRRNDTFRLWILVSMHSQIVETGYFRMYSAIAIFAEYFVCFLDQSLHQSLITSGVIRFFIGCNELTSSSDKPPSTTVRLLCTHRRNPFMLVSYDSSISFTRREKHSVSAKIKPACW